MSLLLDALKKSEAQRRRGSTPTIDLTRTPSSGSPRRPVSRWLFVLLAVVPLVAAAPWLWPRVSDWIGEQRGSGQAGQLADGASQNAAVAESESAPGGEIEAVAPTQAPAPVAGASSPRRVAAVDAASPETAEVEGGAGTSPASGVAGGGPDSVPPATDGDTVAGGVSTEPETAPAASSPDAGASVQELRRRMEARQREAMDAQSAAEPAEEPVPEPSRQVSSPAENFIRPWELPQAQRAEFPELRLTVHFYAESAAERFVLINGERYREGQRVGPGTRLAEIRQRGAVVEFGSYRVLIE